ncbi:uncharacterized protein LOC119830933 [Zerene cesonia]|uniref:uncharacterized protein LOC119830933 n=1 Tax=Zerene cesonia TaxID=33412 RepID=UPI0018E4F6C8|nr:uncharacterized protein LOC119830933 [Zerene cesonia]
MAGLLERAGACRGARDAAGHTLAHYRTARTLLALPAADMPSRPNQPGLVIKRHNIRIWCHECDMGRLQRVVWEGQGSRLLSEVSSQPIVKKFLEAVPYMMNTIRDIHNAVIQNDLEGLIKLTNDPVPPQILSSKDTNNMTVCHKAAGLGHCGILKYLIERYPQSINEIDNDGRTPLHYAAIVKDDQHTFKTLSGFGADEGALDNKNKTPAYYINRPQEIDKNLLKVLPDAPRTPSSAYPPSWDWKILDTDYTPDLNKKPKRKNFKASTENISSKTLSNTLSENTENNTSAMKNSSTHELISNLPELNDSNEKTPTIEENTDEPKESTQKNQTNIQESIEEYNNSDLENHNEDDTNNVLEENPIGGENIKEEKETIESDSVPDKNISYDHTPFESNDESRNIGDIETNTEKGEAENTTEHTLENEQNIESVEEKTSFEFAEESGPGIYTETNKANFDENLSDENCNKDDKNDEGPNSEADDTNNDNDINTGNHAYTNEAHDNNEQDDSDQVENNHNNSETDDPINNDNSNTHDINDDANDTKSIESKDHEDSNKLNGIQIHDSEEDDASFAVNEGKIKVDHSEDDDDVQAQGDTQTEHNDIHIIAKETQKTGSAVRSDRVSSGTSHAKGNTNGRNTQESLIEGIVSSEAEKDSQDASVILKGNGDLITVVSILIGDNQIDPEVTELINTGNMEMLATLVLNGEGSRLIGRYSDNLEIQAFLENVPVYMQKINKVHLAAKTGNIRELQAALDRRKFAIARDPISANGATPLHVATVYGKTNIIKYLGGRFPETLSAVDFEGRTALHYAAVLPDNGHYYNLLQQLGANSKDLDDNGQSADDYYKNPNLLPFNHLLTDFGISEEEIKEMFSDKDASHAANGQLDIPIFHTEEGRYLAKSLGDPLIKGLTEVANVKPKDPIAFLASFLHNFPDHDKPRLGTPQESNTLLTKGLPEFENDYPPPNDDTSNSRMGTKPLDAVRSAARTTTRPTRPIDVITVEPLQEPSPDAPEAALSSADRDEHGQSMLHFAAARPHTNNALFQLLQETEVSIGYRDELYRTARDISIQANVLENTAEIDRFVLHLAARGNSDKIMELLLQGYDHILDVVDEDGVPINEVISQRGDSDMANLLGSIPAFEESRERLHGAARRGDLSLVREILSREGGATLARAQNSFGRSSLHVAVLAQHEDVVAYLAETFPNLLKTGDNLERTALHYAMGVDKMESLSRILTRAGAKRVLKDLKGRQPTYYFMNKSDILRLKEEEEMY